MISLKLPDEFQSRLTSRLVTEAVVPLKRQFCPSVARARGRPFAASDVHGNYATIFGHFSPSNL